MFRIQMEGRSALFSLTQVDGMAGISVISGNWLRRKISISPCDTAVTFNDINPSEPVALAYPTCQRLVKSLIEALKVWSDKKTLVFDPQYCTIVQGHCPERKS